MSIGLAGWVDGDLLPTLIPMFDPQDSHGGRREPILSHYLLISTYAHSIYTFSKYIYIQKHYPTSA